MSFELTGPGESEYVEKKSRFLGVCVPVSSEEEALEFIKAKKKEHYSARHNCFAYIISGESDSGLISRYSDDGEPSGTAGRPILDAIEYAGVTDCVLVVTRYFGGVLLGTGGLTRAYGQAAKDALANAPRVSRVEGRSITIQTDYNGYGRIEYILREAGLDDAENDFTDKVTITVNCPEEKKDDLVAKVIEETSGSAVITVSDPLIYLRSL